MNSSGDKIVETFNGRKGIVFYDKPIINGKVIVHLNNYLQMLCDPNNLKFIKYLN